jgi:hypothetical protein
MMKVIMAIVTLIVFIKIAMILGALVEQESPGVEPVKDEEDWWWY